jgi:hypothetical protein
MNRERKLVAFVKARPELHEALSGCGCLTAKPAKRFIPKSPQCCGGKWLNLSATAKGSATVPPRYAISNQRDTFTERALYLRVLRGSCRVGETTLTDSRALKRT